MANGTSREGTSADDASLSVRGGEDAISNLLGGLDDDVLNPTDDEDQAEQGNEDADVDEASDEDTLQIDDEEVDQDGEETAQSDDEKAARGGSFVPETGKVKMPDGTVLSVADLKRNNLFQADYTRKTTEHKAEVEKFNKEKEFVGQHAERVAKERTALAAYLQKYVPQPPSADLARTDMYRYNIEKAEFEEKQGVLNSLYREQEQAQQKALQDYQEELEQIKVQEATKLFERKPAFRDQAKFTQWYNEAASLMVEKYGFAPKEVSEATDHRFYLMMDDLKALHRAREKAQQKPVPGQQRVQNGKPKLLAGSNRNDSASSSKRVMNTLTERHQKQGTMESGVAKLRMFKDL